MGDYWTNSTRHPEDVGTGNIRRTVTFDIAAASTGLGLPIGALEPGALPLHCHVTVQTAFDGTTPSLIVGTTDDDDGFATAAGTAVGTAGWKDNLKGALSGIPLAGKRVVYAKLSGTGQTAGKATVVLVFSNKREVEGIPFPNN